MRVGVGILFGILLLVAAGASARTQPAPGEPGQLTVALAPTTGVTVGDRVEALLTLTWSGPEPVAPPRFPTWGEAWGAAEVLAVGEVEAGTPRDRWLYRQTVTLTAFRPGEVTLPPVTVAVPLAEATREVRTAAGLAFEVVSVLPAETYPATPGALEPRPPALPRPLPAGPGFPWTAGLLAGLCLLAAAALGRRLGAEPGAAEATARRRLGPLEELLERLAGLDPSSGGEPVHTRLSLALRGFLGRALGIRAREGTTSEIGRRLRATGVPPALAHRTVLLLRDCDQVKFAGRPAGEAVTGGRLATARRLGREIDELQRLAAEPRPEAR